MKASSIAAMAAAVIAAASPHNAESKGPRFVEEQRELALFMCLRLNYKALGADIGAHDYSSFHPRYGALTQLRSPEYDLELLRLLQATAGKFHEEELPVHAEGASRPHTAVFARCVEFSESKVVRDFIRKHAQ